MLKRVDAWWTVLAVDPIAIRVARRCSRWAWITPTGLTWAAHLLGLVSAVLFAFGWLIPAALLFEVRFVLDCADGKLARIRGTSSAAGALLDYVGDYLVVAANLSALAIWLVRESAIPVGLAVASPALFLAHIAAGQAAAKQAAVAGAPVQLFSESMPSGYRAFLAERRLKPLPSRIEAEHGLLFVVALVAAVMNSTAPLEIGLWAVALYFGVQTLHIARLAWDLARRQDRGAEV